MDDLIKGKIDKDEFWDRNNVYFGGDLKGKDQDEHESDYEASSSGRDQFDSDFDLTDSYPGKRGRKKGQKVKRRIKREGTGRPRGRPRKIRQEESEEQEKSSEKQKKVEPVQKRNKKIYKQIPLKNSDVFIIYKAISVTKKISTVSKKPTDAD